MPDFFTDSFIITDISNCSIVSSAQAQLTHKNRFAHGLIFKLNGTTKYTFSDNQSIFCEAGTLYYLPKFSNYEVSILSPGNCYFINFQLQDPSLTYPAFARKCKNPKQYASLFTAAMDAWSVRQFAYFNFCIMQFYNILYKLQTESRLQYAGSRAREMVETADKYILQNLSNSTLSVTAVANVIGVTPEYFRRIFREVKNTAPGQYILGLRLERAKELLQTGDMKVYAVGEMCGFENASYFSYEFKKATSYTPTEYMRLCEKL